jgi:hypothetical protein
MAPDLLDGTSADYAGVAYRREHCDRYESGVIPR